MSWCKVLEKRVYFSLRKKSTLKRVENVLSSAIMNNMRQINEKKMDKMTIAISQKTKRTIQRHAYDSFRN